MSDVTPRPPLFRLPLLNLLGRRRRNQDQNLRRSITELMEEAAEAPEEPGSLPELDRQERLLIDNVLRLSGKAADDVMIPRADIVAMQADVTLEQALEQIRREGHSRLPVYGEQLDDIVGMIHIKDVYAYIGRPEAFKLANILRHPLMVAPQVPVLDLLLQMRQARMHLALVVDEYGGIDGLLTIEDLVETIVGDISDEHDELAGSMLVERADGTLDLDARLPVEEFEARVGSSLVDEDHADVETVGGLVFTLVGRVPARGEVISHPSGIEFRVIDADARRIRKLRARLPVAPESKEAAE